MAIRILTLLATAFSLGPDFCHSTKHFPIPGFQARDYPPFVPSYSFPEIQAYSVSSTILPVTPVPSQTPEAPEKRAEDTGCDGNSSCTPSTTTTERAPQPTSGRVIITFKDDADPEEIEDYIDALWCQLPEDHMSVVTDDENEVLFIVAVLDDMPVEELRTEIVDTIEDDAVVHPTESRLNEDEFIDPYNSTVPGMDSYRRDGSPIATSKLAPRELRFVSQPKDPSVSIENVENYAFPAEGGVGIPIYILDSGLFLGHDEFDYDPKGKWTKGELDFLGKRGDEGLLLQKTKHGDDTGHGTCMISKAVGNQFGVAKGADIIVGRFQTTALGGYYASSVTDTLFDAIEDIKAKRKKDPDYLPIVVLAISGPFDIPGSKKAYRRLNKLDVPTFVSSGPDPKAEPYPRKHEREFENFFIIGEVDDLGRPVPTCELDNIVLTSAPGWSFSDAKPRGIKCAGIGSKNNVVTKKGPSFAVSQAAAWGAMALTTVPELRVRGEVSQRLKAYLKEVGSYPRGNSLPRAIWNGINQQYPNSN